MFNFIVNLFKGGSGVNLLGALSDERTQEERKSDYRLEEMVASVSPVPWVEKKLEDIRKFPLFDQDGSGSCVAQTLAKLLGIIYWLREGVYVHFSATHIYQRRMNSGGGMYAIDALNITTDGVTLEELVPSQAMSDYQMDNVDIPNYKARVGEVFQIKNYVQMEYGNIDTIASVIHTTGKGVMCWFYFTEKEWKANDDGEFTVPEIKDDLYSPASRGALRHSVAVVDFLLYKGKKALVIEDSARFGSTRRRIVTEDFFKARNYVAAYLIDFKFAENLNDISRHKFTRTLMYTPTVQYGDEEVIALQNLLKRLGFFPTNIESTGWYGSITVKAVKQYQKSKGLNINGVVDESTRASLNADYS